jgi:antirestriction protein
MTTLERLLEQIPTEVLLERLEVEGIGDIDEDDVERTEDQFLGVFDDVASFAVEYLEGTGVLAEVPKALAYYIDFDAWARDAEIGGDVQYIHHFPNVYVFSNHA